MSSGQDPLNLYVITGPWNSFAEFRQGGISHFLLEDSGQAFHLRITNDIGYKVLVMITVDGLDVMTGRAVRQLDTLQRGYQIKHAGGVDIQGWRLPGCRFVPFRSGAVVEGIDEMPAPHSIRIRIYRMTVMGERGAVIVENCLFRYGSRTELEAMNVCVPSEAELIRYRLPRLPEERGPRRRKPR